MNCPCWWKNFSRYSNLGLWLFFFKLKIFSTNFYIFSTHETRRMNYLLLLRKTGFQISNQRRYALCDFWLTQINPYLFLDYFFFPNYSCSYESCLNSFHLSCSCFRLVDFFGVKFFVKKSLKLVDSKRSYEKKNASKSNADKTELQVKWADTIHLLVFLTFSVQSTFFLFSYFHTITVDLWQMSNNESL